MTNLTIIEYITLDGIAQAPGHADEDTDAGFPHGGWAGPHLPDHREYGTETYQNAAAFLFGRRTYDIWLPHWPAITDPTDHIAAALNTRPKYVAPPPSPKQPGPAPPSGQTASRTASPNSRPNPAATSSSPGPPTWPKPSSTMTSSTTTSSGCTPSCSAPANDSSTPPPTRHDLHLVTTVTTRTGLAILTYERTR